MANEATLIIQKSLPINMTCADGTGIEKGTILKLADPFTASAASADDDIVAGIAAVEKIASDGVTKIAVYRDGIFRMKASGSIAVGDSVGVEGDTANSVHSQSTSELLLSGMRRLGFALETAANAETFLVELNIGSVG